MARYLQSESMELSPEGMVSKVNGLSNKCRGSEISDYDCIGRKGREISITIYVMLVTFFIPVLGPARDFFITIFQKNDLQEQIQIYSNIAQTYGIVLTFITAFTLYKRGKLSEKLDKAVDDSLELREKYDPVAFKKKEQEIINEYECMKTRLTDKDTIRLKHYVYTLKEDSELRKKLNRQLRCFIYFHSFPLILYIILLLFFRKTEFQPMINGLIFTGAVILLFLSFCLTFRLGRTLRE